MCAIYPVLEKKTKPFTSFADAHEDEINSLVSLDKKFGDNATQQWIKLQLLEVFTYLGALDSVLTPQVVFLSRQIRSLYYYLTPNELTYFFEQFIAGRYGSIYVGKNINPQVLMIALKTFENEAISYRMSLTSEEEKQRIESENRAIAQGKTGLAAWRCYCAKNGITNQELPLQGAIDYLRKKRLMKQMIHNNEN